MAKPPTTGFGIDLWHAVEFSRYERARTQASFAGLFSRQVSKPSGFDLGGQIDWQEQFQVQFLGIAIQFSFT